MWQYGLQQSWLIPRFGQEGLQAWLRCAASASSLPKTKKPLISVIYFRASRDPPQPEMTRHGACSFGGSEGQRASNNRACRQTNTHWPIFSPMFLQRRKDKGAKRGRKKSLTEGCISDLGAARFRRNSAGRRGEFLIWFFGALRAVGSAMIFFEISEAVEPTWFVRRECVSIW